MKRISMTTIVHPIFNVDNPQFKIGHPYLIRFHENTDIWGRTYFEGETICAILCSVEESRLVFTHESINGDTPFEGFVIEPTMNVSFFKIPMPDIEEEE